MQISPVSLIMFGSTSDLVKHKIIPALGELFKTLPEGSVITAAGRRDFDDKSYKDFLSADIPENKKILDALPVYYCRADISQPSSLEILPEFLKSHEPENGTRVFYLATGYNFFIPVVRKLKELGLNKNKKNETRIIFEKPFGNSLSSAKALDKEIHAVFPEEEIFKIDHYLAKEPVQNLLALKCTNPFLNTLLNKQFISHIEIIADESLGAGKRINYFNSSGVLRDMAQNHLLQLLSIILMKTPPNSSYHEAIHTAKVQALESLKPEQLSAHLLGQYSSYQEEAKAANMPSEQSRNVETFAKLSLTSSLPDWQGTLITIKTGKRLLKKNTFIRFTLKPSLKIKELLGFSGNQLIFEIYPSSDIYSLNIKNNISHPVSFNSERKKHFEYKEEYAFLLSEAIKGSKEHFAHSDEIYASWKLIDYIESVKDKIKFVIYKNGSDPENQ